MTEPRESLTPHTVAARVAAIVLAIAAQRPSSQTELARLVGLPLSTTHRLLTALMSCRIVERTVHGHYELTLESTRSAGDLSTLQDQITHRSRAVECQRVVPVNGAFDEAFGDKRRQ